MIVYAYVVVMNLVTVRTAKSKGSCAEYDAYESLRQKFPNVYLTKQQGFQLMWDLQDDVAKNVFEVKRLKGISWNQCVKFWEKLWKLAPRDYQSYLIFKSNQQPALVFHYIPNEYRIQTFKSYFGVDWIKHTPVKRVRKDEQGKDMVSQEVVSMGTKIKETHNGTPEGLQKSDEINE
jgi:hypothetical protein